MSTIRITVTLDRDLWRRAREVSGRNFSRLVAELLAERVEVVRRQQLREALIARCREGAEEDREICHEWRHVDAEVAGENA